MGTPIPEIPSYNPPDPRPKPEKEHDLHVGDMFGQGLGSWVSSLTEALVSEPTHWRLPGQTRLQGMLDYVTSERRVEGIDPWEKGLELYLQCQGGEVTRDRRRYTVAGPGGVSFYVGGQRNATYGKAERRCEKSQALAVSKMTGAEGLDADWGVDSLRVLDKARYEFHSRTLLMSGFVERTWNGGVVKMCSMEGVICGGAMVRAIAGPSATMSGLATADVYGGIARAAATRTMVALLHYRAAKDAMWAMLIYNRNANFVIEPLVGTVAPLPAYSSVEAKLAKIGAQVQKVSAICPVVDILFGVFVGIPVALYGLGKMISAITRKPNIIPPMGPPKVRNQAYGIMNDAQTSVVYL